MIGVTWAGCGGRYSAEPEPGVLLLVRRVGDTWDWAVTGEAPTKAEAMAQAAAASEPVRRG